MHRRRHGAVLRSTCSRGWVAAGAALAFGALLCGSQAPPADAGTQGVGGGGSTGATGLGKGTPTTPGTVGGLQQSPLPETVGSGPAPAQEASRLPPSNSAPEYFITIGPNGDFLNGCDTFYPTGWNQFEVVEAGAGVPKLFGASIPVGKTGPQLIRDLMAKAVRNKFNTVRFFAFGVSPEYALQTDGRFNEGVFRGLDYALETARQYGVKVILPLVNNWNMTGGADEMLAWNGLTDHEMFFSDAPTMTSYKSTVRTILTRVNTINGRTYFEDPAILAWNLINEPRCYRCGPALQTWISTMAAFVKSIDNNHLLGIGEEGFYPQGSPGQAADPLGAQTWAGFEGQNFPTNTATPGIDYGTMHLWVDNWKDSSAAFPYKWIQQHIRDGTATNKPVLLQEFGKYTKGRDALYQTVYQQVYQSASTGGPLKGASFWQWYDEGQEVQGGGAGDYGILDTDPEFSLIINNAKQMAALSKTVPGCTPATPVVKPPSCNATWVNGTAGTGYEGPACDIDINECTRGTAGCAAHAGCTNTVGSYKCTCDYGYTGDGKKECRATSQLGALTQLYQASPNGTLACQQGADVTYPAGAPGFAYDPTGAYASLGGYGSLLPVSVQGCQQACQVARGCDSVSYNPTLQTCFLKAGGSATDCPAAPVACAASGATGQDGAACSSWVTLRQTAPAEAAPALEPAAASTPAAEPFAEPTALTAPAPEAAGMAGGLLPTPSLTPGGPRAPTPSLADSRSTGGQRRMLRGDS